MPPSHVRILKTTFSIGFKSEYKSLDAQMKQAVKSALILLKENACSTKLRLEKLNGYKNPSIYTIHVTSNHSYKISFELNGNEAILRRIATHKIIDRAP